MTWGKRAAIILRASKRKDAQRGAKEIPMALNLIQLQSYDASPLQQLDQQLGDAIRHEHTERRRKIEERKQRKLKKRKQKRRRSQDD